MHRNRKDVELSEPIGSCRFTCQSVCAASCPLRLDNILTRPREFRNALLLPLHLHLNLDLTYWILNEEIVGVIPRQRDVLPSLELVQNGDEKRCLGNDAANAA